MNVTTHYLVPGAREQGAQEVGERVSCSRDAITTQATCITAAPLPEVIHLKGSIMVIPGPNLPLQLTHWIFLHKCCSLQVICFMTEI